MIEKTVLRLLAIKDYSYHELKQKLTKKNFPPQEIEKILDKYTIQRFINDKELANRRAQLYKNKGYGPKWIAQKLKSYGLTMGSYSIDEQLDAIRACLKKPLLEKKTTREQISSLERRGFDLETIFQVISLNK
jgi:SOS response regulatory protein OraA/RecX